MPSGISKKERTLPIASVAEPATELAQVGQRLRKLRVARGISLRELARTINVSPSLISHIELGKGAPSVKTLYALIAAFGISMSEVFQNDAANGSRQISSNGSFVGASGQALGDKTSQSNKFVQRASTRRAIQLEHGFRWECLTPGTDPDVEFMETIIAGRRRPTRFRNEGSASRSRSTLIFWSHATQFGLNPTYLTACGTQVTSRCTQFGLSEVDQFSYCLILEGHLSCTNHCNWGRL